MQTRIREVRKAKGLTLAEVAARCSPPTTAQTIGRLETGTRTVSVGWLNRIAGALEVDPSELVRLPDRPDVPVAAVLGAAGAERPRRPMVLAAPRVQPDLIGLIVEVAQGEYRAGDEVWLMRLAPQDFLSGLNKDVLAPLPENSTSSHASGGTAGAPGAGFIFGRLVAVTPGASGTLQVMPLIWGSQPITLPLPEWIAVVSSLMRKL